MTRRPPPRHGLVIRLHRLTDDELRHLVALDATSDEGKRIRFRALQESDGPPPLTWERGSGRWLPLVWFAEKERIMPKDELDAALARLRGERAA